MISFNLNYSPKAQSSNIVTKNIQFSSVTQSLPSLYEPKDCSTPGFPVHHQLLEFAQVCVHWISDTTQLSHPLLPSSAFNLSQHQGLFQWVDFTSGGQSIEASVSASILPMNIQGWFPLGFTGLISLQSKGLSRVFSNITVWKYQFFSLWNSIVVESKGN